jgi:membrane fusion protein, heavy metal efflux system
MFAPNFCSRRLFRSMRIAVVSCVTSVFLSQLAGFAHEGHDHDDSVKSALAASTYPRVAAQSELYEIVGILKDGRLAIYLDYFPSNQPVTDAKVKVTIGDGEPVDAEKAENGTYTLALPRLTGTGSIEVVFSVIANSGDDLLVGSITPLPNSATAVSDTGGARLRWVTAIPAPIRNPIVLTLGVVGLGVLFGQFQRKRLLIPAVASGGATGVVLGLLVAVALSDDVQWRSKSAPSLRVDSRISDAPRRLADGSVFVAKPTQRLLEVNTVVTKPETVRPSVNLIGRVIGDPNRTSVVQSIHGGRVIPLENGLPRIGQTVRKGEPLARVDPYLPLADLTTISEKAGEIEQLITVAEIKLRRLRPLAERGAVPQSQITDLETELEGLRRRRDVIRSTRTEPEVLRALTDGVVAAVKVVPGQVVQAQDLLFQIVDPKGLWVEAFVYGDIDPSSLDDAMAVTTTAQVMSLSYQGFSRALQQHASMVHFAIREPPPNLSIGQPLTVMAKRGASGTGLIVRRDAVVRGVNGEAMVWLHVDPERFEARSVKTQQFDAAHLIVAGGMTEGERVVIGGADLINQIR